MHDSVKIFRGVTSLITSLGAGAITSQFIKNNTAPTGKITAITMPVAAFFIGGVVANAASKHAEDMVTEVNDSFVNAYNETQKNIRF